MVAIFSSVGAIILGFTIIALYVGYRAILPKPLPGIPYNEAAAGKLFGDVGEMMGYVMRTKRIFVRHYRHYIWIHPICLKLANVYLRMIVLAYIAHHAP